VNARPRTAKHRGDGLACLRLLYLRATITHPRATGDLANRFCCWENPKDGHEAGGLRGSRVVLSTLPLATHLMCPRLIWLHPCAAQSHLDRASVSSCSRFLSPGLSALASIARSFCGRDVKSGAQRLISTLCSGFPGRLICSERRAPLHSVPSCWGVEPSFPVTRFC
jgi:hypothetical protein